VEREGCAGGFAGFAGAGEEVEGEDFHLFVSFYICIYICIYICFILGWGGGL
jgi:hypothetical protein